MPEGLTEDDLEEFATRFTPTRDGLRSLAGDAEWEAFTKRMLLDVPGGPTPGRIEALRMGRIAALDAVERVSGTTSQLTLRGAGGKFLSRQDVERGAVVTGREITYRSPDGKFAKVEDVLGFVAKAFGRKRR